MHKAVINEDVAAVVFLMSVRAEINSKVQNPSLNTPLHLAVKKGTEIVVRHLVWLCDNLYMLCVSVCLSACLSMSLRVHESNYVLFICKSWFLCLPKLVSKWDAQYLLKPTIRSHKCQYKYKTQGRQWGSSDDVTIYIRTPSESVTQWPTMLCASLHLSSPENHNSGWLINIKHIYHHK